MSRISGKGLVGGLSGSEDRVEDSRLEVSIKCSSYISNAHPLSSGCQSSWWSHRTHATVKRCLFPNKTDAKSKLEGKRHQNKAAQEANQRSVSPLKAYPSCVSKAHSLEPNPAVTTLTRCFESNISAHEAFLFLQQDVNDCMFLKGPKINLLFSYMGWKLETGTNLQSTTGTTLTTVHDNICGVKPSQESDNYTACLYTRLLPKSYVPNFALRMKSNTSALGAPS